LCKVIGLDPDEKILNIAKNEALSVNADINWIYGFSTEINLPDRSIDLVTNSLMVHHLQLEDKIETFHEVLRVLKPGGKLVLVDWGKPSNFIYYILYQLVRILDGFNNTKPHQNGDLPQLLIDAGFKEVKVIEKINTILGTLNLITAMKSNVLR
jgi:ubiquinone/menaquinone biosynthesis C-methylase UbiE